MSDPNVFIQRSSGGAGYALLIILLVFPVMGVTSFFGEQAKVFGTGAVLATVGLAAAVLFLVRAEYRLELGASSIRFSEAATYFGIRRPAEVKFEIPFDDQTRVRQVNTRTPSSRGGWNHGSALHFPGDHQLTDFYLGSREDPKSEYNRLLKVLEERLGERFTVEEKV